MALAILLAACGNPLTAAAAGQLPGPTFTRDVAPIFHRHCTTCHRPGQISPMSLLTYKDARPWSRSIRARVAARTMPPWFAADGHRPLAGDRRLSDNDLMTILAWVDGGAIEGNPADLPPEPAYAGDAWQIGTADAVFQLPREFPIPATGLVDIQYFDVPSNFSDDQWIQAIEVRPGDLARVHFVAVYHRPALVDPGAAFEEGRPPVGTPLAFYASGADPVVFPDGIAQRLPAGSRLVFEVHYATNGSAGQDRTRLALRFANSPPLQEVHARPVSNTDFIIPPGESQYQVRSSVSFDGPVSLIGIVPHAHRRGKTYEYRLLYEDGRAETILSVPRYNWLWESAYRFVEPIAVPPHASIEIVAVFDNSAANKANPDPKSDVRYGWDPATREMMFSYIIFAMPRTP